MVVLLCEPVTERHVRARKLPSRPLSIAALTLPATFAEIWASLEPRCHERVPRLITIGSCSGFSTCRSMRRRAWAAVSPPTSTPPILTPGTIVSWRPRS